MSEQPSNALESQIQQLERELAAKRAELGADMNAPYERAEVHEAVGEQIRQAAPTYEPKPAAPKKDEPLWNDPAMAETIQQLVNVAFTQSIQEAIVQAQSTNNPALVDALHDILADQFHEELLNRQKLQPAP